MARAKIDRPRTVEAWRESVRNVRIVETFSAPYLDEGDARAMPFVTIFEDAQTQREVMQHLRCGRCTTGYPEPPGPETVKRILTKKTNWPNNNDTARAETLMRRGRCGVCGYPMSSNFDRFIDADPRVVLSEADRSRRTDQLWLPPGSLN